MPGKSKNPEDRSKVTRPTTRAERDKRRQQAREEVWHRTRRALQSDDEETPKHIARGEFHITWNTD